MNLIIFFKVIYVSNILLLSECRCSSYVGRQGGSQVVSLEDECFNPRIVKHELMHAIGFYHEQSRTDRDDYVVVHFDNVEFGNVFNQRN